MKEILNHLAEIVNTANYRKSVQTQIASLAPSSLSDNIDSSKVRLLNCGDFQAWKVSFNGSKKIVKANLCNQPKICPLCAHLLSLQRCVNVLQWLNEKCTNGFIYNLVLTVKDKEDLSDARYDLSHLKNLIRDRRKNVTAKRFYGDSELSKFQGYFLKEEIKRGSNSGLWHPHFHGIGHSSERIDYDSFRLELNSLDNENHSNFIKLMASDDIKAILEAVKYSLKFTKNEIDISNIWQAFNATYKQKLFHRYGSFRGLKDTEEFEEIDISDSNKPFWLAVLKYSDGFFSSQALSESQYINTYSNSEFQYGENEEIPRYLTEDIYKD